MKKYLSVCSGIEAATVAWHGLGWEPAAFAEIEPFPAAVLAHHYPNVPNYGDMTNFLEWDLGAIDLLVGGTPCQAFSVAGLRRGLADERGNLSLTFCELADHFDPEWIAWENVPGVLSSKDNAFGCFLAGLVGADEPITPAGKWQRAGVVSGPKRTAAWRVLDAQYFGVAQRRRRVFVLAVRGADNWRAAAALFPVGESVFGNSPPSRSAGQNPAADTLRSTDGGGDVDHACAGHLVHAGGIAAAQSVALRGREGGETAEMGSGLDGCLRASGGGGDKPHVLAFDPTQITHPENRSNPQPGDPCHTLPRAGHVPAVCVTGEVTHTLRAEGFDAGEDGTGRGHPIVACIHSDALGRTGEAMTPSPDAEGRVRLRDPGMGVLGDGTSYNLTCAQPHAVAVNMSVRRLMPLECERLQGFPDGYTDVPVRGKPAADGPRYKALGNSMAVPVMRWIGRRIAFVSRFY